MRTGEQPGVVAIVDDDGSVRSALMGLLRAAGYRARAFASAGEFLASGPAREVACLVLDVRMPGMGGLDLFERLAAGGVRIPVLFITAYADVPMAVRAMKSGAVEFLEKPFNGQVLLEKIQQAVRYDAARLAREAERDEFRARFDTLTDKEREVLDLIREGRANKEIAARLAITPRAVEIRRASLMRKLAVGSLSELLSRTIGFAGPDEGEREPLPPRSA